MKKPLFNNIKKRILGLLNHPELVDNDREILFDAIKEKYCIHCGKEDPACQCWADDED